MQDSTYNIKYCPVGVTTIRALRCPAVSTMAKLSNLLMSLRSINFYICLSHALHLVSVASLISRSFEDFCFLCTAMLKSLLQPAVGIARVDISVVSIREMVLFKDFESRSA